MDFINREENVIKNEFLSKLRKIQVPSNQVYKKEPEFASEIFSQPKLTANRDSISVFAFHWINNNNLFIWADNVYHAKEKIIQYIKLTTNRALPYSVLNDLNIENKIGLNLLDLNPDYPIQINSLSGLIINSGQVITANPIKNPNQIFLGYPKDLYEKYTDFVKFQLLTKKDKSIESYTTVSESVKTDTPFVLLFIQNP